MAVTGDSDLCTLDPRDFAYCRTYCILRVCALQTATHSQDQSQASKTSSTSSSSNSAATGAEISRLVFFQKDSEIIVYIHREQATKATNHMKRSTFIFQGSTMTPPSPSQQAQLLPTHNFSNAEGVWHAVFGVQ